MLEMCARPLERCFGRGDGGGGDGLLWHMDLKSHASGDYSIAVVQANSMLEDQGQVFTSPSATYVGVYDGHGGPEASRFITRHLFPFLHISEFTTEQGGLSAEVIKKAFDATEEEFLHLVKRSWSARPQIASVGSCCLVGVIAKDVLYVANLGDSRAVLGRRVSENRKNMLVVAERLSVDHNVGVEEVRKEVEALHPDDSHIVVFSRGVWRIKGIIQVSRSIGDVYLKKPEFSRDHGFHHFRLPIPLKRAVMTAEPSILIRKLKSNDLFLIFASDGLWEQLSDEAAVEIVSRNPRSGIAKRLVRAALQAAARKREMRYEDIKRIQKGARRHFHDDITVVVIYLDHPLGTSSSRIKDHCLVDITSSPVDVFSLNANEADDSLAAII
ncbi:putative protein phosphatase 2C 78 [Citrus sinensis]|uniref:protein-serine/threonine phosphatase n=1 Tax=Citrus sinensis TaxID=2711 RepID=A0A067GU69_CITSI|nr:probable protein phosphatase 2C 78 isoform X3 [Citrus sinensis]XP_024036629.1 probable protein phosphatase 2C 78 isoform X1 [Citrus x clementina]KAH9663856.1 putative protein phosphatase 2C 78 [Citrus sinensis]KDO79002.1 hypothetical protein CISIN_1g016733mg [Citrus sinensis]